MLDFLYTQTYDLSSRGPVVDQYHKMTSLSDLVDLYALGDKYAIPALCDCAAADFGMTIRNVRDCEFGLECIPQIYRSVPENDTTLKELLIAEIILRYCSYSRPRPGQAILLVSRLSNPPLYPSPTTAT